MNPLPLVQFASRSGHGRTVRALIMLLVWLIGCSSASSVSTKAMPPPAPSPAPAPSTDQPIAPLSAPLTSSLPQSGVDAGVLPSRADARCPTGAAFIPSAVVELGGEPVSIRKAMYTVAAFCIDTEEIDRGSYEACLRSGKCKRTPLPNAATPEFCCEVYGGCFAKPRQALSCVTYGEIQEYCRSVGGRTPTTTEWEYAARGLDGRTFPGGTMAPHSSASDWVAHDISPFGVKNLMGGVREWTSPVDATDIARRDISTSAGAVSQRRSSALIWLRGLGAPHMDLAIGFSLTGAQVQDENVRNYFSGGRCAYDVGVKQ